MLVFTHPRVVTISNSLHMYHNSSKYTILQTVEYFQIPVITLNNYNNNNI